MYGVFDGHGQGGGYLAALACKVFAEAPLESSFPLIFAQAEEAAAGSRGGTTASVLRIDAVDGSCQVGHVGDSDVRYFDEDDGDGVSLTADHSPCSIEEFHRIKAFPSDPPDFTYAVRYATYDERDRDIFVEKDGAWIQNPRGGNYYCTVRGDWAAYIINPRDGEHLAVTRAIGDFGMKRCGVSAEPTVTTVPAPKPGVTRAIVLASDGLWDVMQFAEVRGIVRNPEVLGNAEAATAALMAAVNTAATRHFGSNGDNVTALVVYVTMPA